MEHVPELCAGIKNPSILEHITRFEAGHDCINFHCRWGRPNCIPGEGGSHGWDGLRIRFVSKGPEGAVQFVLATGWVPQYATRKGAFPMFVENWGSRGAMASHYPSPFDLGYHSKISRYEEQAPMGDECEFTGGACYYDGSTLNASEAMYALVNGGSDALWAFLDTYYECVFHGGPFPVPAEYVEKLREAAA